MEHLIYKRKRCAVSSENKTKPDNRLYLQFSKVLFRACSWCTSQYKHELRKARASLAAYELDKEDGLLKRFGLHGYESIEHMVNHHPYDRDCLFARFMIDCSEFLDDGRLKASIHRKGLCVPRRTEEVIFKWITNGKDEHLYTDIMRNVYKNIYPLIHISAEISDEVLYRFVDYFDKSIQLLLRRGKLPDYDGTVKLYVRKNFWNSAQDIILRVCRNEINCIIPRMCTTTINLDSVEINGAKRRRVDSRFEYGHVVYVIELLRRCIAKKYKVITLVYTAGDFQTHQPLKSLEGVLNLQGPNMSCFMTKPVGLLGLCWQNIVYNWNWRAHDIEQFTGPIITNEFF